MQKIYCRWAPSLGELEGTHQRAWGTENYDWKKHRDYSAVFFGLYDLRDYLTLWNHRGKSWVFWAGSDIRNLLKGFILNDGKLKTFSRMGGNAWVYSILKKSEHWVENTLERDALKLVGIDAKVCPSFLGNIKDFDISYVCSKKPQVYLCASEGRQEEYGFNIVERIATRLPQMTFHLYGASWETENSNVIVHGRVSKEQMNSEIKAMQIGLRLNFFEGFSEILAKAILMGHQVVSRIEYPYIRKVETDDEIVWALSVASATIRPFLWRFYYEDNINSFPWVTKEF